MPSSRSRHFARPHRKKLITHKLELKRRGVRPKIEDDGTALGNEPATCCLGKEKKRALPRFV